MPQDNGKISEKVRILVVEDDEIALKNLSHILRKEGYDVDEAGSGKQAIEYLRENAYDLVLTDLKMAKIDGMEVLASARRLQPDTETIIITGHATVDSAVEALKKKAHDYITKPYRISEIREIVQEALYKRRQVLKNRELKKSRLNPREISSIVGRSGITSKIINFLRKMI